MIEFAHGGVSVLVGTCGADLAPDCVRGVGIRVWPGGCRATVLVPLATSAACRANLAATGRVAVTLAAIPTHRSIQLKGPAAVRDGDAADHELARRYRAAFAQELGWAGHPLANGSRLAIWPCAAIELEIEHVFAQTPGPAAGERMPLAPRPVGRP